MGFRNANRGQAIQVGAILLFALLILGISIYQATVVPQQNARVEFDAYQAATDDMVSVRDDVVTAGTEGASASTTVRTGATYPARSIFVNPGAPSGTVSTAPAPNVSLSGVRAVESEPENVQRFWNTTSGTYETNRVTFDPSYNEFDGSPITVADQSVYRLPDDRVLPISAGSSIQGNRITLVTVRGDFAASGRSVPLTADPVSTATRTVVVTGTGATFDVTVPTPIPASAWNDTVAPDVVANPNVVTTTPVGDDAARITFDGSRQYELRLAAVELRAQSDSSVVERPDPTYVVPVTANGTAVGGQPTPVTVEVRDRYDNPVSGTEVNLTLIRGQGQFLQGGTTRVVSTDGEGRATVSLRPAASYEGNLTVRAQGDFDGNGTIERIERTDVGLSLAGSGDTPEVNEETGGVALGVSAASGTGRASNVADITLNNTADADRTITEIRVAFYFAAGQNAGDNPSVWEVTAPVTSAQYEVGAPRQALANEVVLPANEETVLSIEFSRPEPKVAEDFFILTVQYEEVGRATYYIAVES
jgi:hypothetical protein